jgi:hypothetical protein
VLLLCSYSPPAYFFMLYCNRENAWKSVNFLSCLCESIPISMCVCSKWENALASVCFSVNLISYEYANDWISIILFRLFVETVRVGVHCYDCSGYLWFEMTKLLVLRTILFSISQHTYFCQLVIILSLLLQPLRVEIKVSVSLFALSNRAFHLKLVQNSDYHLLYSGNLHKDLIEWRP